MAGICSTRWDWRNSYTIWLENRNGKHILVDGVLDEIAIFKRTSDNEGVKILPGLSSSG
jgi:hypothetical protein